MNNDEKSELQGSVDGLAGCVLAAEDYEEASDALIALKKVDKIRACEVALKIVREHIGDIYFQAFAFEILYTLSVRDAVSYIEENVGSMSDYMLGVALDSVTADAGALESRDEILKAVSLLRKILDCRSKVDLGLIARKIEDFKKAYP